MSENNNFVSVAVMCIDYRFWPCVLPLLQEKYGLFDLIEIAGGAKNLVSPLEQEDQVTLLENIDISMKLHNAKQLILLNHVDCGAYGGSKIFSSKEEEIKFHENELKETKNLAQKKFPGLAVKVFLVDKDDEEKVSLVEIF